MKTDLRIEALVAHLDSVFFGSAWHGAALLPTVRAFDLETALLENSEGYSAWKIVLHCAFWKFDVRRRLGNAVGLTGSAAGTFPRKPRDFPRLPDDRTDETWRADRAFLEEQHALLRDAVLKLPPRLLGEVPPKGRRTCEAYILGAASHDVYHTAHIRNLGVKAF